MFLRLFLAWILGSLLYLLTLVATDDGGFDTFTNGLLHVALSSAAGVGACEIVGLLLRIPAVRRLWRWSLAPVYGVVILGGVLFAYAFLPGQLEVLGNKGEGHPTTELGQTWLPGYLLLLFAATNWPRLVPSVPEPGAD